MDFTLDRRANRIDWLAKSSLAPHVAAYTRHLTERGYAPRTIDGYVGHPTPQHGNAPVAVRRSIQRHSAMAGPQKHDYHASARRGRLGNEGKGPGTA